MRGSALRLVVGLCIVVLLAPMVKVVSARDEFDTVLAIDGSKHAFFGWWNATQIHDSWIWDLFGRTIDWALGANVTHQDARIVFFTYSGDLDPTNDEGERDCIVFHDQLIERGFQANNIEVHPKTDVSKLPSMYYENFDLALYTSRISEPSQNLVDSGIPLITVSANQTTQVEELLEHISGWTPTEAYGNTFVVVDRTYYPTETCKDGFLTCESALSYDCIYSLSCLVKAWQIINPEKYPPPSRTGLFFVLVNALIYANIESRVSRYAEDVHRDLGMEVRVNTVSASASPADIKKQLQEAGNGLQGCLLVGDIATALINGSELNARDIFPTDFFYMDLDGNWSDVNNDGVIENYALGGHDLEIWVARLNGSVDQINNYFDRNHAFRMGTISFPPRALVYKDDDWIYCTLESEEMIPQIYPNTSVVLDRATTCRADYLNRIAEGWSIVHLLCHSYENGLGHVFKVPDPLNVSISVPESQWVSDEDYELLRPPVLFYNLYVCGGARFTDSPCLGYSCINSGALVVAGQTTTGYGMIADLYFYNLLSQGRTFGEAFREGYNEAYQKLGFWYERGSYLDEVLLGDPTLRLKASPTANFSYYPKTAGINETVVFNASSSYDTDGTIVSYQWDFGDDSTTTTTNPTITHTYKDMGNYLVTLNVTDNQSSWSIRMSTVVITIPGDVDGNFRVKLNDLVLLALAYGSKPGDSNWNPSADIDRDGAVGRSDIVALAQHYGQHYP
jgi:hypothetical protein